MRMKDRSCGIDLRTPRSVSLSAFYKRSFAYHTVKNRMPVILTQLIDILIRKKEDIMNVYGKEVQDELKGVISEISKMKYEIQTNKPLADLTGSSHDIKFYNEYLLDQTSKVEYPTYFNSVWLHSECYMYRKLRQIFELTTLLRDFDPFHYQKQESFKNAFQMMVQLGIYLENIFVSTHPNLEMEFIKLLKLNLWGNKCDLSISNGVIETTTDHIMLLNELNSYLLCDDSAKVWTAVSNQDVPSKIIDIILDNSGYELFTDLCMADFIIKSRLAEKIRFYVKNIPWFISDVTINDFNWTMQQLMNSSKNFAVVKNFTERWHGYLRNKIWTVEDHSFWTLPVTFTDMAKIDPDLYQKLGEAKVIFFKGDLNYRKLFGEKNWDPVMPVDDALQGFHPSRLCILRTLKADIVCGLRHGLAEEVEKKQADWMVSGSYGVIQYSDQIVKLN